jgi:hypothetical protein
VYKNGETKLYSKCNTFPVFLPTISYNLEQHIFMRRIQIKKQMNTGLTPFLEPTAEGRYPENIKESNNKKMCFQP